MGETCGFHNFKPNHKSFSAKVYLTRIIDNNQDFMIYVHEEFAMAATKQILAKQKKRST